MDSKFYVITYKETTTDSDGVLNVESGVFDYGFDSLEEAKKSLIDVGQRKVEDFDDDEKDDVGEHWTDDRERLTITYLGDTYEYSIYMVIVPRD